MIFKALIICVIINEISSLYLPGTASALTNLNKARLAYNLNALKARNELRNLQKATFGTPHLRQFQTRSAEEDEKPFMREDGDEDLSMEEFNGDIEFVDMNNEKAEDFPLVNGETGAEVMEMNADEERSQNKENMPPITDVLDSVPRTGVDNVPPNLTMQTDGIPPLNQPRNDETQGVIDTDSIVQMGPNQDDTDADAQQVHNNFWAVNNWMNTGTDGVVRNINTMSDDNKGQLIPAILRNAEAHHLHHKHFGHPSKVIVHEQSHISPHQTYGHQSFGHQSFGHETFGHNQGFGHSSGSHSTSFPHHGTSQIGHYSGHGTVKPFTTQGGNIQITQVNGVGHGSIHQQQNINDQLFVGSATPADLEEHQQIEDNLVGVNQGSEVSEQDNQDIVGADSGFKIPGLSIPALPLFPQQILPTDAAVFEQQRQSFTNLFDHNRQDATHLIQKMAEDQNKLLEENQKWLKDAHARSLSLTKDLEQDNHAVPIFKNNLNQNIDLNHFGEPVKVRRQVDEFVPEVKDGKIPVQIVEEPINIIRIPNEENDVNTVAAPYLFDLHYNQREAWDPVVRSERNSFGSNLGLLNMAQGITQGTLGSVLGAGQVMGNNNNGDSIQGLQMASGITNRALGTALTAEQMKMGINNNKDVSSPPNSMKENSKTLNYDLNDVHDNDLQTLSQSEDQALLGMINQNYMDHSMLQNFHGLTRRSIDKTNINTLDDSLYKEAVLASIKKITDAPDQIKDKTESKSQMSTTVSLEAPKITNMADDNIIIDTESPATDVIKPSKGTVDHNELNKSFADEVLGKVLNNQKDLTDSKNITGDKIKSVLEKQKAIIEKMKENNDDSDMYMIAHFGEGIINDTEKAINLTKREIQLSSDKNRIESSDKHLDRLKRATVPLNNLVMDPDSKLDIPKTIDNLGAITRHMLESENAPLYHVRNLMGSTHNTILSAMRVPPKKLLIPTSLSVVRDEDLQNPGLVGAVKAINPDVVSNNDIGDGSDSPPTQENIANDDFGISSTFAKVGAAIKNSIQSGRETLQHVNDIANNAKNVINTAQNTAPLITHSMPESSNKATIIGPRILDISEPQVGDNQKSSPSSFLKLSEVMDSVGLSNPNPSELEIDKLVIADSGPFIVRDEDNKDMGSGPLGRIVKLQNKDITKMEKTLSNLEEAKQMVGAPNLREFILQMKNHADSVLEQEGKLRKRKKFHHKKHKKHRDSDDEANSNTHKQNSEEVSLDLPPELMHPFMNRASEKEINNFAHLDQHNSKMVDNANSDASNGDVLDPSSKGKRQQRKATFLKSEYGDPFEELMKIQGEALKPYSGYLPQQNVNNYFNGYNKHEYSSEENSLENSYENTEYIHQHFPDIHHAYHGMSHDGNHQELVQGKREQRKATFIEPDDALAELMKIKGKALLPFKGSIPQETMHEYLNYQNNYGYGGLSLENSYEDDGYYLTDHSPNIDFVDHGYYQ